MPTGALHFFFLSSGCLFRAAVHAHFSALGADPWDLLDLRARSACALHDAGAGCNVSTSFVLV